MEAGVNNAVDSGVAESPCEAIVGQALPARLAVVSNDAGASTSTAVFVDDIFNRFNSNCGGCHVAANLGNFQFNRSTFASVATQTLVDRMSSDDANTYMPPDPVGKPALKRGPEDPVSQLLSLVQKWLAAGKPKDLFYIEVDTCACGPGYLGRPHRFAGETRSDGPVYFGHANVGEVRRDRVRARLPLMDRGRRQVAIGARAARAVDILQQRYSVIFDSFEYAFL